MPKLRRWVYVVSSFRASLRKRLMKKTKLYGFSLCLGVVLTMATLMIPVRVDTQEQLTHVALGYPARFITQNMMRYTPLPDDFPIYVAFDSPLSSNFSIHVPFFVLNVLIIGICIAALAKLGSTILRTAR